MLVARHGYCAKRWKPTVNIMIPTESDDLFHFSTIRGVLVTMAELVYAPLVYPPLRGLLDQRAMLCANGGEQRSPW
jgi:hypothetical protein